MRSITISEEQAQRASAIISAVANGKRISLIKLLLRAEKNVGDLTLAMGLSQSATSQHLTVLKKAGILDQRKDGVTRYCSINPRLAPTLARLIAIAESAEQKD